LATVLPFQETAFGGLDRQAIWHRRTALVWRSVHRLTGVFVILAMVHGFLDFPSVLQQFPLLNITYLLICGVGVAAFLYRELLMRYFLPRTEYSVDAVERPDPRTLLVNLEPCGEPLAFAPGQFVYVNFDSDSWRPHPFTVASGSSARQLQLAIRASGDETRRLYQVLHPGVTAVVAGPHSRFDYRGGGARQVWIAAGIGVTPFMSWIRSLDHTFDREVDFFYVVHNEHDAPFLKEIQEAAVQHP
jgi:predicted ferric reductase